MGGVVFVVAGAFIARVDDDQPVAVAAAAGTVALVRMEVLGCVEVGCSAERDASTVNRTVSPSIWSTRLGVARSSLSAQQPHLCRLRICTV